MSERIDIAPIHPKDNLFAPRQDVRFTTVKLCLGLVCPAYQMVKTA